MSLLGETRVVGIWAPAPQSGKSTLAGGLNDLDMSVNIRRFADPLRRLVVSFLESYRVDPLVIHAHMNVGALKERPIPGVGKSFVDLMIAFGTKGGREALGADVWVDAWKRRVREDLDGWCAGVISDDVRFRNEAEAVRALGGIMVGVIRPGATVSAARAAAEGHLSEDDMDILVYNVGTIEDMVEQTRIELALRGVAFCRADD